MDIPSLKPPPAILEQSSRLELQEYAAEIYEWLSLVRLESPRVAAGDVIDPYLSRYAVPGSPGEVQQGKLCKVSWVGFMPPTWTRQLLADIILALPSKSWFSLSVTSLRKDILGDRAESMILRPPHSPGRYFLWDIKGHD